MYLPLAAIVSGVVAGSYLLARKGISRDREATTFSRAHRPMVAVVVVAAGVVLAVVWGVLDVHRLAAYQDPVTLWQSTIREGGADSFAYNNLGYELLNAKQTKEAMESLQQALKLNDRDPKIYTNLGMALDELGRPQEAIEQFQQA